MEVDTRRAGPTPFAAAGRKPIRMSGDGLVKIELLDPEGSCPLVVQPVVRGVDLAAWTRTNLPLIQSKLQQHGALLFRGFGLTDQEQFSRVIESASIELMHYMEGATPRKQLSDHVYTSTEFPPEHAIALHNELSYVLTWPMKVAFFCVTPAVAGGETPIADVRKVYQRLPAEIVERFRDRGWMLSRSFGDGLGLTWENAYRTSDREALEAYAREARLTLEWKDDRHLRTRQVRPAITTHPVTGETVWFNHVAFWHVSSLEPTARRILVEEFGEDGVPYNTWYGDGTPIEDSVVETLRQAYDAETVAFPWQQGDLLLLDNMLVAHGRRPFKGPRKIVVSMGEPFTRTDM